MKPPKPAPAHPVDLPRLVRRWVDWPSDECESCGGPAEIFTEEEEGYARDGDSARCLTCGTKGAICCDSESPAVIAWDDDDDMPNDPKLSDGGGWRAGCTVGGKAAAEAASVTAGAVRGMKE